MAIGNSDGGDCQLEVATDRTARLARRWQQRFWRRGELIIRAPWGESLSLNNEVNICVSVSFVPLQIIMRSLFRLIICTFCYDISFKY
jgi:hypothetical protein